MTKKYNSLKARPHTPPYKIHRYYARRPWNVFRELIDSFTDKNDIILDPFCGGGVTIYEGLRLHRKVVGFDLNPLSIFIVRNMVKREYNKKELKEKYQKILSYLDHLYGNYANAEFKSEQQTLSKKYLPVLWNELALKGKCPHCHSTIVFSNENKVKNGKYVCPNKDCKASNNNEGYVASIDCERTGYIYLYSVIKSPVTNKRFEIPFNSKRIQEIQDHMDVLREEIQKENIDIPEDKIPLNWDRQKEDLLKRKGINTFQDFFTERNLLINLLVLNFIQNLDTNSNIKELLRMAFSSSLRDTNMMSFTNKNWQAGKPITWSKHAYWIPHQFCEVNVKNAFKKGFRRLTRALKFNSKQEYNVNFAEDFNELSRNANIMVKNASVSESNIPDGSVDCIITDPPYGSNVQYLELSHFWYPWNKDLYDRKNPDFSKEAVANRKKNFEGAKSLKDYENNLYSVFLHSYNLLKPSGYMVMTFNNKDVGAWLALLFSIFRAGFVLDKEGLYFQSGVKNYKQTAHTKYKGSPYGDFIYVFKKPTKQNFKKFVGDEDKLIKILDKRFSEYITQYQSDKSLQQNQFIKKMMLDVIPVIESFAKTKLMQNGDHKIFEKYKKNHLKNIYSGKNAKN